MPIVVKKQRGETKNDLINRFRRLFIEEEILEEIRERARGYVKKARKRYERKKELKKIKKN